MKFMTLMVITFVIIVLSSPILMKAEVTQSCVPMELMPCLPAMTKGEQPTTDCCENLIKQKTCLCDYIKNPLYSMFTISLVACKVLETCNVPYTSC
ncbi:unnamed protein product [Arabidopsis thaliana]|uniref:Bifunctional inhibitor/plant lipid transfer protein/seed storage helical domain-containing protein n=1 Tax=Arabidopsis thaliana TaxID=3702 RepID=A0A654G5Z7_ARATH|nr:unnamed protein product [Arabidopsis thaliana]